MEKRVKQEDDEDTCGGEGTGEVSDLCRLRGRGLNLLIWNRGGQSWVLTLSEHQGVPGERGGLCLLNSGGAAPSDVPLTCGMEHKEPGSKGRGGRRG